MVSSIAHSQLKENSLFKYFRKGKQAEDAFKSMALGKLPALSVPRPNPSAAGLIPLWDLFQDEVSQLGVIVLKDGSYRCCYELDGVHVSGFDEVRLGSLMNHF